MILMSDMKVELAANVLKFKCGCSAQWEMVGVFAHIPEWHIIPCYKHANNRQRIEEIAEGFWNQICDGVKK